MITTEERTARVDALADKILLWAAYHADFNPVEAMNVWKDREPDLNDVVTNVTVFSRVSAECSVLHRGSSDVVWALRPRVRRKILTTTDTASNAYDTPIGKALRGEEPYTVETILKHASPDVSLADMQDLRNTLSHAGPQAPGYAAMPQLRHAHDMKYAVVRRDAVFSVTQPTAEDVETVDALMDAARNHDAEAGVEVLRYLDAMLGRDRDTPSPA